MVEGSKGRLCRLGVSMGERALGASVIAEWECNTKGLYCPCCTEENIFLFLLKVIILVYYSEFPLVEDKLHKLQDIALLYTTWASSHYRKTCRSKIDCIMIWNNGQTMTIPIIFFSSITKSHLAYLVYNVSFSKKKKNNKIEEDPLQSSAYIWK